jgi:hypothetical protein
MIARGLFFELTMEHYFKVRNVTIRSTTFKIRNGRYKAFIVMEIEP